MTTKEDIYLDAVPEDIEDILEVIEESFNIKFSDGELKHIRTFGELCNHIVSKVELTDTDDCTTQQAFYRLRDAITQIITIEKDQLKTDTRLSVLFPKKKRKATISKVESLLAVKLYVLRPRHIISNAITIFVFISLVGMFFKFGYGLIGFVSGVFLFRVAEWTGIEFKVDTLGQLADKMSQENYIKSRRNQMTVNRKEITKTIEKLFTKGLGLKEIKPEALILR
jgi:hypothetical protein